MRERPARAPGRRSLLPAGHFRARDLPRREVTALAVVVLLLTIVPATVSLLRPSSFRAHVDFVPVTRSTSQAKTLASARRQINVPFLRLYMEARMGRSWTTYRRRFDEITFSPGPSRSVVMTVPGATPREAVKSAELIVPRLMLLTHDVRRLLESGIRRVRAITATLKRGGLTRRERRRLGLESRFIIADQANLLDKVPLVARGSVRGPRLSAVDRALQRLHAGDVPRPAPGWAALAGLLLGLALVATWLTMRPGPVGAPARGP